MKKRSLIFFVLLVTGVVKPMHAMDEPEAWDCEFFNFSKILLKDFILSIHFKCNNDSPVNQLFKAIHESNVTEVGSLLHEYPALLDTAEDNDGVTPLLAATIMGQEGIVAHMLSRGPQVDRCTHQGFTLATIQGKTAWLPIAGLTPLMAAAQLSHVNIVKQLLAAGAQKELEDYGKKNALVHAKENGNITIINLVQ